LIPSGRVAGRPITLDMEIEAGCASSSDHARGEAVRNVLTTPWMQPDEGRIEMGLPGKAPNGRSLRYRTRARHPGRDRDKIFDSFVSTKERGMGLGLAYVKRVVDACGGRIEVKSTEGKGTTFKLYFQTQPRGRERTP
jgi:hypothetical protein